jgi:hypothetical protein
MALFWTVWASVILGILVIASFIEWNGARKGFHGANGIFLFASGYLTFLSAPILFIATWIWADFWTAARICLIGAAAYAVLFALALKLIRSAAPSTKSKTSQNN